MNRNWTYCTDVTTHTADETPLELAVRGDGDAATWLEWLPAWQARPAGARGQVYAWRESDLPPKWAPPKLMAADWAAPAGDVSERPGRGRLMRLRVRWADGSVLALERIDGSWAGTTWRKEYDEWRADGALPYAEEEAVALERVVGYAPLLERHESATPAVPSPLSAIADATSANWDGAGRAR